MWPVFSNSAAFLHRVSDIIQGKGQHILVFRTGDEWPFALSFNFPCSPKGGGEEEKTTLLHKELLTKATAYVEGLFRAKKPDWVKFHSFRHARAVAKACQEIGAACHLTEEDLETVTFAAWFHDTGYLEGIDGHEEKSVQIAAAFLRENGYPEEKIAQVAGCIRATRLPQNPKNLLEQVLCDADIAHLASQDFFEVTELIRSEIEHRMSVKLTEEEWLTKNTDFVAGHEYHTDYARSKYAEQQAANLEALKKRLMDEKRKRPS